VFCKCSIFRCRPLSTLRTHTACTSLTLLTRSLADRYHVPSAILIRPRLGACTSSLLQSVLPVKGWTSARPQPVENPLPLARIAASPAVSRTLYLSHLSSSTCCLSHSLSLALFSFSVEPPPTTTTARSLSSYSPLRHFLYRNKHCLSTFVSHSPSPAAPRALCISSHFLSKICLNLGAFLQDLARCYLCSTHAVAANKDLCANSQIRWQYC
jgi:hypothetical protein